MSRLFKIIAVLVALPVLGVISLLLILDNPTVYQEPIGDAFRQKTGLELNFNGDIQWRFFPPLAININEIEIKSPDSDTPLASLNSASIDLKLIPIILEGKIVIEAIEIDGVDLNAVVSEQGIGNWERPDTADSPPLALPSNSAPAAETESETEPDSQDLNLDISAFTLTNAHIDYQDLSAKTHMMLNIDKLSTGQLSPGQLTELNTIFSFEDKIEKLSAKTQIDGSFKVSDNLVQLTLENFVVDATILQQDQVEVAATIKINAEIDSDKATASFSNSSINVADLVILLTLKANNIFTIPGLRGNISIPAFDAKKLAKEMAIEIPATSNPDALTSVSVTTDITGTTDQMVFSNITATLDRSTITGKATITLEPESALEFSLAMDAINATGYLEPDVSTSAVAVVEKTPASAQAANDTTTAINIPDSEVIPIELLNELALQGTFTLAELQYDEYLLHDITVGMNNKNQTLTLASRAVGYDGQLGLDLHLKPLAPGQNPTGRIQLTIADIDITKLIDSDSVTGAINMDSTLTFSGDMMSEILSSLDGKSDYTIKDGTLDVTNIKQVVGVIDSLRGKTSSVGQWPEMLPFKFLTGYHQISQGIEENQLFSFAMENMEVNGKGGMDYFANSIDFDIQATFKEGIGQFSVNPNLAGVDWPMNCKGSLGASFSDLCKPDKAAITGVVKDIAEQELKRKGKELTRKEQEKLEKKIEEHVPEEFKETAKKLLKGLFD